MRTGTEIQPQIFWRNSLCWWHCIKLTPSSEILCGGCAAGGPTLHPQLCLSLAFTCVWAELGTGSSSWIAVLMTGVGEDSSCPLCVSLAWICHLTSKESDWGQKLSDWFYKHDFETRGHYFCLWSFLLLWTVFKNAMQVPHPRKPFLIPQREPGFYFCGFFPNFASLTALMRTVFAL